MMSLWNGKRALAGVVAAVLAVAGLAGESRGQAIRGVAPRYGEGMQVRPRAVRVPRARVRVTRPAARPVLEAFDPMSPRSIARSYALSRQEVYRSQWVAARLADRALAGQRYYHQAHGLPGSAYLRMGQPFSGGSRIPVGSYWPASYPAISPFGSW